MEMQERKIYAVLAYMCYLDEGNGVSADILKLNANQTGINLTDKDLLGYAKQGILLPILAGTSNLLYILSEGALEYMKAEKLENALKEYEEIRPVFQQSAFRYSDNNTKRLRELNDPVGLLLFSDEVYLRKKDFSKYERKYEQYETEDFVQCRESIQNREYWILSRGEKFHIGAANLLKKYGILAASGIKLNEEEINAIRSVFPEFNNWFNACPYGVDSNKIKSEWKPTQSLRYSEQRSIPGGKVFVSREYSEFMLKPEKEELWTIAPDVILELYKKAEEIRMLPKNPLYEREEDTDSISTDGKNAIIDVPSFMESTWMKRVKNVEIFLTMKTLQKIYNDLRLEEPANSLIPQ